MGGNLPDVADASFKVGKLADLHFGWGRNNVRRSLEIIRDQAIPPEANISSPRWFEVVDPDRRPTLDVVGSVSSPRLTDLRWELFVSEKIVGPVRSSHRPEASRVWSGLRVVS